MATVIRGDDNWDTALKAGSMAFAARFSGSVWATASSEGTLIPFNDDSTQDSFDTDNCFNTSTSAYTAPTTGIYMFWMAMYTAQSNTSNGFRFHKNNSVIDLQGTTANRIVFFHANSDDKILNGSLIVPLSAGDAITVASAVTTSDYHTGYCMFGGCRLS